MPLTCNDRPSVQKDFEEIIYPNCIPEFVAADLETLYGSLYSSLPALSPDGSSGLCDVSTYARWHFHGEDRRAISIFLFRQDGQRIRVINEGMRLQRDAIDSFCEHLFSRYPDISQIEFHAIAAPPQPRSGRPAACTSSGTSSSASSRPCVQCACTEDIVISLPRSGEQYLEQLGKSTRKSLKKNLSRAQRELPDFLHQVRPARQVSNNLVRQVVGFNHARMAQKHRISALDLEAILHLLAILREHGIVGLVWSGKQLCAGTLACRLGDDVYSLVNAHDPAFDHLGLGSISRHLMILEAIASGAQRFHLLGGNLRSKRAALGERQRLDHLRVYRSHLAMWCDVVGLAKIATGSAGYLVRSWLEDLESSNQPGWMTRCLMRLHDQGRAWRRKTSATDGPTLSMRGDY